MQLPIFNARTPAEIDAAFASAAEQHVAAVLVGSDALFGPPTVAQLVALAARYRVPAIYPMKESVEAGGLMSYGPSIREAFHLLGTYVGRILKGEKPSELPVQQSTRIEMVLNLKTAKALGIEVPTATLLRATEVIE